MVLTSTQLHSLSGLHTWFYYTYQSESFISREKQRLLSARWILNNAGELVSADAVTVQSLSDQYDTASAGAKELISFLGIHDEALETAHLSEEESRKIRFADEIEKSGLSENEIRAAIEEAKHKKSVPPLTHKEEPKPNVGDGERGGAGFSQVLDRISDRIRKPMPPSSHSPDDAERERTPDSDDYNPTLVDYSKKIARAEERNAAEITRLEHQQKLLNRANALSRYTYGWFLALLELECMASSEKNADGKTISIGFGKIEKDGISAKTIILKEPNRFIPQSVEEFSGVRVDLYFSDGRTGKLHVESFTAKEFSLLGKLKSVDELNGIDLDEVVEARIEVQNPSFLLGTLLERFRELRGCY